MQKNFVDQILIQIRHFREGKHMSQVEMANHLNIGTRSYQRYESGESLITIDLLFKLSQVLGFDMKELCSPEEFISSLENVRMIKEEESGQLSGHPNYPFKLYNMKGINELLEQEDLKVFAQQEEFKNSDEALALSTPKVTLLNPKAKSLLGQSTDMIQAMSLSSDPRELGLVWAAAIKEKPKLIEFTTQFKTSKGPRFFSTYNIFMQTGTQYFLLRSLVPKNHSTLRS